YGSTIQSVFENRSSIGSYFQHSFRHIFRLTGFQLAIILLMLPLFLMIAAGQFLFDKFVGQDFHFLFVIFSIILLLLSYTLFLHTPIFIIRYRMKIWRSIGLSFRLFFKKPFRVFFSGLLFFG